MIKSVITHYRCWGISEMLVPICIGETQDGYNSRERLNRLLPDGHRYHGYEG